MINQNKVLENNLDLSIVKPTEFKKETLFDGSVRIIKIDKHDTLNTETKIPTVNQTTEFFNINSTKHNNNTEPSPVFDDD